MSETLPNIPIGFNSWVDLSTESGIAVGSPYEITNEFGGWILLHESSTVPDINEKSGKRLAVFPDDKSSAVIKEGSLKVWAKLLHDTIITGSELSINEL